MKVIEVIDKLKEYNLNAKIGVIAHNKFYDFSFCFGSSDGVTKENCEEVCLYVDKLNKKDEEIYRWSLNE